MPNPLIIHFSRAVQIISNFLLPPPGGAVAGLLRQVGHLQGDRRAVRRTPADDQLRLVQPLRASVSVKLDLFY